MKRFFEGFAVVFFIVATVGVAAQADTSPGAIIESRFVQRVDPTTMQAVMLGFYPDTQYVEPAFAVDEYRVRFYTQGEDGAPIPVEAQMYVPVSDEPLLAPIYVYGSGTTGLSNRCATILENPVEADWGNYRQYLRTYATQGFIVIMPDYVGFHIEDTLQRYYVSVLQGRLALDGARAVYNLYGGDGGQPLGGSGAFTVFDGVFVGGYSQGGTTAFAARDVQPDYAPEIPLLGVLAYGSVTDQTHHHLTRPEFAAYRWVAWEDYYGADRVDLSLIFDELWLPTVRNDALRLCVDEVFRFYPKDPTLVYTQQFYEAVRERTVEQQFPQLAALMALNTPGYTARDVPVLVLQAEFDETIPPAYMTGEILRRFCEINGNVVTYREYLSRDHYQTRQEAYIDTVNWMVALATGQAIENNCPQMVAGAG
jgi:pimeloyl-ACP methyl ester carboxylesterase